MGKKATFILIDKIFTVLSFINAFFIVIFSNNLFISYRDNEISGYLGFIIPFMILLNIIFIIVWLFKKKWIVSIILLICLFCSYNFINVRYQFRKAPPKSVLKEKSNPNNLRLITYNIEDFVPKY